MTSTREKISAICDLEDISDWPVQDGNKGQLVIDDVPQFKSTKLALVRGQTATVPAAVARRLAELSLVTIL